MNIRFSPPRALLVFLAAVWAPPLVMAVPTEIARESFEGAGGTIGFTTSVAQFDEPTVATSDFFSVILNNGSKLSSGTLAGGDGGSMFAAEDIDTVPGPGVGAAQSITFNPVNIAGKTSTSVKILLAAPGTGGAQTFYDWSATAADIDFLRVEASVDGGPFNRLAQFSPSTNTLGQPLSLDTDGDGLGGQGAVLTAAFQEFNLSFPTGTSVQIRVVMHSNATSEYLCIDNVRIFGDSPVTAPPALAGVPGGALVFTEGSAAVALAPAITVTDADSANLSSATVTISSGLTSSEDVLAATPSGAILAGDIVYTAGTGTLTIIRSAPLATWQAVLRSVTYKNTNVAGPNTATRNITFSASDGVNASNSPIRQVDVVDAILTHNLPFTESFETDGRGTRYALDGRFTNGAAMFDRGTPAGVTNLDGTFAIIAEDTLLDAAPVKAVAFLLNTAPFGSVNASVRLGALGGAIYDTGDVIAIEASVNGAAFTTVAAFRSTGGASTPIALDTDLNGVGDGTQLSTTMQDFSFSMPAATTLGLRVRCASNTAGERLIVDRIVMTGNALPTVSTPVTDVTANEDAANGTVNLRSFFSDAEDGAAGLTYTVQANTNSGLVTTSINNSTDVLTLDYVDNANGTANITIRATDTGGLFVEDAFLVTVNAVNDAPGFTKGPNLSVFAGAGAQTAAGWATAISAGPANESGQVVTFNVSNDANALFSAQPAVASNGKLTLTPAVGANGSATVSVAAQDNGGTAAGGVNTSAVQSFTVSVFNLAVTTDANAGAGSLRQAIADAATLSGAQPITLPAALEGQTITLASEIVVNDAAGVTLDGAALSSPLTISGGAGTHRLFSVAAGTTLNLTRLTLTSGHGGGATGNGSGGAIYNAGTLALTDCTLSGNTSANQGGAIANSGSLAAVRCTFSGNTASSANGGAVANDAGTASFTNCTFSGNAKNGGTQGGGGINHSSSATSMTLLHCTIAGNSSAGSEGGGGIRNRGPLLTLNHCIIAGNTLSAGTGADVNTTVNIALGGANIIRLTAGSGIYTGTGINSTADPLLAPLGSYGGQTQTMALLPGSPARNGATGSTATGDQRGFAIVGTPDIGAYEAGTFTDYNAWAWETLPATATPAQHVPAFDYDNDGQTNNAEWLALSDPGSAASVFRPTSVVSGSNLIISFPTVTGRTYTLERTDTLAPGSWTSIGLPAPLAGTGAIRTFTVPATTPDRRLFRVQVGP